VAAKTVLTFVRLYLTFMNTIPKLPVADILDFTSEFASHFKALNEEWITQYFVMEEADHQSLGNPQGYIIDRGGYILMARYKGEIVGTCALINEGDGIFELAKMAVSPKVQGLKIGKLLGKAAIQKARDAAAIKLYLVSNRKLETALNLYKKLGFTEVPMSPSLYARADIKMEISFL
jgi:GNAT superfamily N-acetyltransferase